MCECPHGTLEALGNSWCLLYYLKELCRYAGIILISISLFTENVTIINVQLMHTITPPPPLHFSICSGPCAPASLFPKIGLFCKLSPKFVHLKVWYENLTFMFYIYLECTSIVKKNNPDLCIINECKLCFHHTRSRETNADLR